MKEMEGQGDTSSKAATESVQNQSGQVGPLSKLKSLEIYSLVVEHLCNIKGPFRNTTTPTKITDRNYNILFHNGRNRLELIDWCPLVVKQTKPTHILRLHLV